jgi:hypothetical protein
VPQLQAGVLRVPEDEMTPRCRCGDPIEWMDCLGDPGWIHSPGGSGVGCTDPKPIGRLRGGLSRSARALHISVSREDIAMTILGGLVGGLMGWLFVAMWIR